MAWQFDLIKMIRDWEVDQAELTRLGYVSRARLTADYESTLADPGHSGADSVLAEGEARRYGQAAKADSRDAVLDETAANMGGVAVILTHSSRHTRRIEPLTFLGRQIPAVLAVPATDRQEVMAPCEDVADFVK